MEERNSTGIVITIIIVILIIIGLVWYFNRDTTDINITQPPGSIIVPVPTPVPTPTPGTSTTTGGGGTTTTTERAFVITARNYSFSLSEIRVRRGDRVSITLTSAAGTHDLKIDGYNVSTGMVNAGQSDVITFTADRVGRFEYYCSVSNHRSLGMKGTFIVE